MPRKIQEQSGQYVLLTSISFLLLFQTCCAAGEPSGASGELPYRGCQYAPVEATDKIEAYLRDHNFKVIDTHTDGKKVTINTEFVEDKQDQEGIGKRVRQVQYTVEITPAENTNKSENSNKTENIKSDVKIGWNIQMKGRREKTLAPVKDSNFTPARLEEIKKQLQSLCFSQ